jgi:hypothetical protein
MRGIVSQRLDQLLFHMIRRPEQELFGLFVVLINRAAVGAAELHRVGHDPCQHSFEIQCRAYGLPDFAEGSELAHRAGQFPGAFLQFLEQPHVLDGDHRL